VSIRVRRAARGISREDVRAGGVPATRRVRDNPSARARWRREMRAGKLAERNSRQLAAKCKIPPGVYENPRHLPLCRPE
jgi:hypothetical protein